MALTVAVSGDAILNRRISTVQNPDFLALIELFRRADVAYTHLEVLIHDYEGPELFPAAEAGWTYMRAPEFVVDELKWAGFDIVSHASNHALDYSYGGLRSTWAALRRAGIPYAGTGRDLGDARAPAYLDTPKGRVALISMTSSFTRWSRAGEARRDMQGRPGVNPLRYYHVVDGAFMRTLKEVWTRLGWWIAEVAPRTYLIHPPGLHHTVYKYVEGDRPGVTTVADEDDVAGNLQAVRDAKSQADFVMVHVHCHEWDPEQGLHAPPAFLPPFARACIEAGADLFISEGSHSPLRGIEIYRGKPIFYDPGDLFLMSDTTTRLPADFYARHRYDLKVPPHQAGVADVIDGRQAAPKPENPPGGYWTARVPGIVVPVCRYDDGGRLEEIRLYPATWISEPRSQTGIPRLAKGEAARAILTYLGELSAPFGTTVALDGDCGVIRPDVQ